MKNILLLTSFFFLINSFSFAQTVEDAIRYSNLNIGGTARTVGVGGAFGALGADFGAITINPAGLGMYRSSEFVLTPGFLLASTDSRLNGENAQKEIKGNFNFNNVGVVFQNDGRGGKLVSNAVAIGFNKVANFNQNIYYEGETSGSITDRFLEQAFGFDASGLSEFESGLAFDAGALYPDDIDPSVWLTDYSLDGGNDLLFKKQTITRSGSMNELVLALGANYNHRLMFGVSVGVPFIKFEETKVYEEEDLNDDVDYFNELRFEENLETSGVGINLKLGLVYRITQMFRLGLAVHTPTGMALNDSYSSNMRYDFTTPNLNGALEAESPEGAFDYNLSTPWRAVVSGAAIIGKSGFITADVEYVNYAFTNFNLTSDIDSESIREFEEELNGEVENQLTSAVNIRIGGEYVLNKLRFRGGFSTAGSYQNQTDIESVSTLSAGVGFRGEYFYIDAALQRATTSDTYVPYRLFVPEQGQIVNNDRANSRLLVTLGFKF